MKKCLRCRFWIQKNQGCNHITCICKNEFCYICGKKWKTCDCVVMEPEPQEELDEIDPLVLEQLQPENPEALILQDRMQEERRRMLAEPGREQREQEQREQKLELDQQKQVEREQHQQEQAQAEQEQQEQAIEEEEQQEEAQIEDPEQLARHIRMLKAWRARRNFGPLRFQMKKD